MSLQQCVDWITEVVDSVPELNQTSEPGATASNFPLAIVYGDSGTYQGSSLSGKYGTGSYTMTVQIHYPLENLRNNMSDTNCVIDSFMREFRARAKNPNGGVAIVANPSWGRFFAEIDGIGTHGPVFTIQMRSEDEA